jgi:quercetin dioxygenase-like cupin family protein
MLDDHLAVAALLAKIRTACDDFEVPSWACSSYRALFRELAAVEQDLFTHVHLENHVLKPRFEPPAAAQRFDLAAEAAALEATPAWREVGHTAKTLLRRNDTRVVLIALRAGARMLEHRTDHSITIQVLAGRVQIATPLAPLELAPASMAFLDAGVPHDVVAHEDSRVLLTIHWQPPHSA